ncbi:MAG: M15 family metallopeptidase [Eubacterium sp.]|nr:M15 family metallopeptidase [Eubacterium sp.]
MALHPDKKTVITCLIAAAVGLGISVPLIMSPAFQPAQADQQKHTQHRSSITGAPGSSSQDISLKKSDVSEKKNTAAKKPAIQNNHPTEKNTQAETKTASRAKGKSRRKKISRSTLDATAASAGKAVSIPATTLAGLPDLKTDDWRLILVNPAHTLPEGYKPETRELAGGIYDTAVYNHYQYFCDERIFDELTAMLQTCTDAGFHPLVASGYREHETQQMLFDDNIAGLEMQGMSREEAEKETKKVVAVPGTSEHELGLALDIACEENTELNETQMDTPTQKWLMENSWQYGFIIRYPTDKTKETGIIFEPWHYRYVGKESARYIHEHGLCLEEYLALLRLRENTIANPNAATEKPDSTPGQKTTVTPGTRNSNSKQKQKQTQPTDGAAKKE